MRTRNRSAGVRENPLIPLPLALGITLQAAENGERLSPAVKAAVKYYWTHGKLPPKYASVVQRAADKLAVKYPHAEQVPVTATKFAKPLNGVLLELRFPPNKRLSKEIAAIPGASYDRSTKKWVVPLRADTIDILEDLGFVVPPYARDLAERGRDYPKVHPAQVGLPKWYLRKLLPYQRLGVAFMESRGGRVLLNDEMGLGKAQPIWISQVLTPNGWKYLADLTPYELIYSREGKPERVLGIFPQGEKMVYRLRFEDGAYTYCCNDHLWVVTVDGGPEQVVPFTQVREWFEAGRTVSVPTPAPIQHMAAFREEGPDPFLVGILISRGVRDKDALRITVLDSEVGAYVRRAAEPFCHVDVTLGPYGWVLTLRPKKRHKLTYDYLEFCAKNRRIPTFAYTGSVAERELLLKGLVGTTGDLQEFTVEVHEEGLRVDIIELARSLGMLAKETEEGVRARRSPTRRLVGIDEVGMEPCACISVSGASKTYVTDDYVVTHNTVQALAWCEAHPEKRPVLVISPASAKYNWVEEIKKWSLREPGIYVVDGRFSRGRTLEECFVDGDEESENIYVVINYDILGSRKEKRKTKGNKERTVVNPGWVDELLLYDFKVLIVDECHRVKNMKAQRSKAVYSLGRKAPHVIAMSGTPIQNGPHEFYPILKLVDPTIVPSYDEFLIRYCGAKKTPWGLKPGKPTNIEELHNLLTSTVMLRRRKADVLKDLPEKIRTAIPFRLENMKAYIEGVKAFAEWARSMGIESEADINAVVLAQLAKLRSLVAELKMPQVIDWIETFLESDQKLVVFGHHQKVLEAIHNRFKKESVLLYGKVRSAKERQRIRDRFQEDPNIRLFVGNFHAAGEAITLTAASHVCFVELDWVPGVLQQAEDRCHRIGQRFPVNIWYLLAKDTVDDLLAEKVIFKHGVVSQVLDGKEEQWFDRTALLSVVEGLLQQAARY